MRRIAFPLILAGTFAVAALGAHAVGSNAPTRVVDVSHSADDDTPAATQTPDAPDDSDGRTAPAPAATASADDDGPTAAATPDAPDDSDGRVGGGQGSDDGPGDDHGDDDADDDGDDHGGDDDHSGSGGGDDRSGSNSGKG